MRPFGAPRQWGEGTQRGYKAKEAAHLDMEYLYFLGGGSNGDGYLISRPGISTEAAMNRTVPTL